MNECYSGPIVRPAHHPAWRVPCEATTYLLDHLQLVHGPEYVTSATVQARARAVNPAEFQAVIK